MFAFSEDSICIFIYSRYLHDPSRFEYICISANILYFTINSSFPSTWDKHHERMEAHVYKLIQANPWKVDRSTEKPLEFLRWDGGKKAFQRLKPAPVLGPRKIAYEPLGYLEPDLNQIIKKELDSRPEVVRFQTDNPTSTTQVLLTIRWRTR